MFWWQCLASISLLFLPHCRVHQTYRGLQHGLRWLDSECGTSPPSLPPSWRRKQTNYHTRSRALVKSQTNSHRYIPRLCGSSDAHLAESVIVMSDTSILRQFSTLSRTGLLTCVWGAKNASQVSLKTLMMLEMVREELNQCTFIPDRDNVFLSLYFPSCWG